MTFYEWENDGFDLGFFFFSCINDRKFMKFIKRNNDRYKTTKKVLMKHK